MRRALFLATAAAIVIAGGPTVAQTQKAPPSNVERAAPPPPAIQNAPAEKIEGEKVAPANKAQSGERGRDRNATESKPGAAGSNNAQTAPARPGGERPNAGETGSRQGTTAQGGVAAQGGAAMPLNADQKRKIRTSVIDGRTAPRITNVNFSISVGTVVPRTVRVVQVPPTIVEFYPRWRGYLYFVHADEIVIVEPKTLRIVAVIEV